MTLTLNCFSEGETLDEVIRRECAIGFDLRFCRSVAVSEHDRDTETCDPHRGGIRHDLCPDRSGRSHRHP